MTLLPECVAVLEDCYRDGRSVFRAARCADVAGSTAKRYYAEFKSEGIPRGEYRRMAAALARRWWPTPYDGPEWIGRPIAGSRPLVMSGPNWIGKPVMRVAVRERDL